MKLKPIDFLAEYMEYPELYSVLGRKEISLSNPFDLLYKDDFYNKNPHLAMITLFQNPEYLAFAAKNLLNIKLAPFQCAILRELWIRKFPMLIATRGCGKCGTGDTMLMLDDRFTSFRELIEPNGANRTHSSKIPIVGEIFGENGFKEIGYGWKNPSKVLRAVQTRRGFSFTGSHNHPIRVLRGKNIVWVKLEDIQIDDLAIIDRKISWIKKTNNLKELEAYTMGYKFAGRNLPPEILSAPKNSFAAFIKGFFDNGSFIERLELVKICRTSVAKELQFILTRFGIIANVRSSAIAIPKFQVPLFMQSIGVTKVSLKNKIYTLIKNGKYKFGKGRDTVPLEYIRYDLKKLIELQDKLIYNSSGPLSYARLKQLLMLTKDFRSHPSWKRLRKIYKQHYYFDNILSIGNDRDTTYDIHVPNDNTYIGNGFICHNSFLLAVYSWLKCLLVPRSKIVVCASAFRQSRLIFDYMYNIYDNSPILRDIVPSNNRSGPVKSNDRCTFYIGDSETITIPMGDGAKIRGLRATDIIAEEFASIRKDIYEEVIGGFAVVSANPVEAHADWARKEILKELGQWTEEDENASNVSLGNKSIISGTASFAFNHFYEYWLRYKRIIESRGKPELLNDILGDEITEGFNWRDYCIIRIPIEVLPKKFMDESVVARSKATVDRGIFLAEYGACFPKDSSGFFRRTLIESCVANSVAKVRTPSGVDVVFDPLEAGNPHRKYVMGVDTASERDNFAIVIIEIHDDHRRVVYCWTTNKADQRKRLAAGYTQQTDFYSFCCRKIRELMKLFPIERIVVDTQGGGYAIMEGLHDKDRLYAGEVPLWKIIDDDKPCDEDYQEGLHIVYPFNFANSNDLKEANYGMRKDMQEKTLLFPQFDPVSIELAIEKDKLTGKTVDTFEDSVLEIEQLKNELASIVIVKTATGRERWDTPEIKSSGHLKARMQKDRYSSLLMANFVARMMFYTLPGFNYQVAGSLAGLSKPSNTGKLFQSGPQWFLEHSYSNTENVNVDDTGNSKIIS